MRKTTITAVCKSTEKGTRKIPVESVTVQEDWGIEGDAHAGKWHRQVSLLSKQAIDAFNAQGAGVTWGEFGENIVVDGAPLIDLPLGTVLQSGSVVLTLTQIGKQCHSGCDIQKRMGICIMPQNGVFTKVLSGGTLKAGDSLEIYEEPRVAIICLSDKASKGEREDLSTGVIERMVQEAGCTVVSKELFPDDQAMTSEALKTIADGYQADIILTTGGTGLAERDVTPEATLAVADRVVPGIAEAMRQAGLSHTPRSMLSRAVAVTRKRTLIINLPGSPRAVEENLTVVIPIIDHAVHMLRGVVVECAKDRDGKK